MRLHDADDSCPKAAGPIKQHATAFENGRRSVWHLNKCNYRIDMGGQEFLESGSSKKSVQEYICGQNQRGQCASKLHLFNNVEVFDDVARLSQSNNVLKQKTGVYKNPFFN